MPSFTVLNPASDVIPTIPYEVRIEDAVARYGEALKLLCQKDFVQARSIFEGLLAELEDEECNNSDEASEMSRAKQLRYLIHKNFSQLLIKCNERSLAIKQAELALGVKHTDAYLWCGLGELLLNAHKFSESVCAFMNGLKFSLSDFTKVKCLNGICEGLFNMGDFETCLVYTEKAIEMDGSYHRGIWIRDRIIDEYSKCVEFSLKHSAFLGDVLALYGPSRVLCRKTDAKDLFNTIKVSNPDYFEAVTRDRIIPWAFKEEQSRDVERKILEVSEMSFYRLGLVIIDELVSSEAFEREDDACYQLPLIKIKSSYSPPSDAGSEHPRKNGNNLGGFDCSLAFSTHTDAVSSIQKSCTVPANSAFVNSMDVEFAQTVKKGPNFQRSRRASKRLEEKTIKPGQSYCESYEKIDEIFSDLENLRYVLKISSSIFSPVGESINSVIYRAYSNILSPPQTTKKPAEKGDDATFGLKCDNKRYYDETMFCDFIRSISSLECDIFHLARMYCVFSITESASLVDFTNYNNVNERKLGTGIKENIAKILASIEKYNMGLHFWLMQISENNKDSGFAFLLSLGEILSSFQCREVPHINAANEDKLEGIKFYIGECICAKCLINKYVNTLRVISVDNKLPKNLLIRFHWLVAKSIDMLSYDYILSAEDLDVINKIYINCQQLISDDDGNDPVLTYGKSPSCITRDVLNERLLSVEVKGYCNTLISAGKTLPFEYFKKFSGLYIIDTGAVDTSFSQSFRYMFNKEVSESVRLKLLGILQEACTKLDDMDTNIIMLSCVFSQSVIILCGLENIVSTLEACVASAKNFLQIFEQLDISNGAWIDVLKTKQAILSDGSVVPLLNVFLNSCYVVASISSLLIRNHDSWACSKKIQSATHIKLLESFCITSWRTMIFLLVYNTINDNSRYMSGDKNDSECFLRSIILNFMSSAHNYLSLHDMCAASDGEFLLNEVALLKRFGTEEDSDSSKENLNQCYRCLYGAYLKDIQTEDHQTPQQKLTEGAALDLFFEMSKAIENKSMHINKSIFQDYTELLIRVGEVLEKKITCKKAIISYSASTLEQVLNQPQSYCLPIKKIRANFFTFPLDELESDVLKQFCEKFYYIFGRAAKGQSVSRRGPIQLVNPEKTISSLSLALKKFYKSICVTPYNWELWMYLGECYSTLENEYLSRSASYVIRNWGAIHEFRLRGFNSFVMAIQLCEEAIKAADDENVKAELSEELGRIWGFIGKLCYSIYDLPAINYKETSKYELENRIKCLTYKVLELKLNELDNSDEDLHGDGLALFRPDADAKDRNLEIFPTRYYEDTVARTRVQEKHYHELRKLFRKDGKESRDSYSGRIKGSVFGLGKANCDNKLTILDDCYPFVRCKKVLRLATFALKRSFSLSSQAKNNWLYHVLLGNASYYLGAQNETVIDHYLTSIALSSKEVFAKDQEIILEPYIELIKFACTSFVERRLSLSELKGLREALSEADNRVFQINKPLSKTNAESKMHNFIEPFITHDDSDELVNQGKTEGKVAEQSYDNDALSLLNDLILRVRAEDKKGWYHEHIYLTCALRYFINGDVGAAKEEVKDLLKLHCGKSKGFLNIWRTDYERPANLFLCTHKYLMFALLLFKQTEDIKSLRKLIKKLGKSSDRLLWTDIVGEMALHACMECLKLAIDKSIPKDLMDTVKQCSKITTNGKLINVLASAIIKLITPDLFYFVEALCLAFEIEEYLSVSCEGELGVLQLQMYNYFMERILAEANNEIHGSAGNGLITQEIQDSMTIVREIFVKEGSDNMEICTNEQQILQFSKVLIRSIGVSFSK